MHFARSINAPTTRQALILITCALERSKQSLKGFFRLCCECPSHIPGQKRSSMLSWVSTTLAPSPPLAIRLTRKFSGCRCCLWLQGERGKVTHVEQGTEGTLVWACPLLKCFYKCLPSSAQRLPYPTSNRTSVPHGSALEPVLFDILINDRHWDRVHTQQVCG